MVILFTYWLMSQPPDTWAHSKSWNFTWFRNGAASFSLPPGLKEDLAGVI